MENYSGNRIMTIKRTTNSYTKNYVNELTKDTIPNKGVDVTRRPAIYGMLRNQRSCCIHKVHNVPLFNYLRYGETKK